MGRPREADEIPGRQALIQFGKADGRILKKDASYLAEKLVIIVRIECPEMLDRLRIDDGNFRHGLRHFRKTRRRSETTGGMWWPARRDGLDGGPFERGVLRHFCDGRQSEQHFFQAVVAKWFVSN